MQIEALYDATCLRIREIAERSQLSVPESLRPTAVPGPKTMYHINLSGKVFVVVGDIHLRFYFGP